MQSFVDKSKSFFNVRTKGRRLVLFNVMVVVAVLGGVFSIIMAIASLLPVQPVPIFIVAILIAALPFYLANYKGRLGVASLFLASFSPKAVLKVECPVGLRWESYLFSCFWMA